MVIYLEKFFKDSGEQVDQAFFLSGILWADQNKYVLYINLDKSELRQFKRNPLKRKSFRRFDKPKNNYEIIWHYNRSLLLELHLEDENSNLVERLTNELKYHLVEIKPNNSRKPTTPPHPKQTNSPHRYSKYGKKPS